MWKWAIAAMTLLSVCLFLICWSALGERQFPFTLLPRAFMTPNKYDSVAKRLSLKHLEPYPTRSPEELQAIEKALSATLPDDYKVFLSQFGVTWSPPKMVVPVPGLPYGAIAIDVFYGAHSAKYDLLRENRIQADRVPKASLAIAEGPNSVIYLSLADADRGSVYHLSYDNNEVTLLSPSFDGFIRQIQSAGP